MSRKRELDGQHDDQTNPSKLLSPDSSVVEVKYKCNDLARIDDFLEWLVEGGKFIINDKVCLKVLWLGDTVKDPYSSEGPWSLKQWFSSERCPDCVSQLKHCKLLDSLKLVDWEAVAKGRKLDSRPSMLASLIVQCRLAVRAKFKNGSIKEMTHALVNIVREYGLCESHKDCVSVKSPCTITEDQTVNIVFKRECYPFKSQRLTGYPDMTVQLISMPHIVVITAELKTSDCSGIKLNDCYKSKLGQLFAYITGHVLVSIGHGADLSMPIYGLYMEGHHLVLTRGLILKEESNYTLRLENTSMGESAIDVFTERGASVVFQSLHTIISTCSAIEPETVTSEEEPALSIDVEVDIDNHSDHDTIGLEKSDCASVSSSSSSSNGSKAKFQYQYLSDSILYYMTDQSFQSPQ